MRGLERSQREDDTVYDAVSTGWQWNRDALTNRASLEEESAGEPGDENHGWHGCEETTHQRQDGSERPSTLRKRVSARKKWCRHEETHS